jgi:hypothetical protein
MQHFGIGYLAAIPSGTNPTPIQFGLVKDVSVDVATNYVKERGQWQHVVAVGRGNVDISGKCGSVSLFGGAIGQVLGVTPVAGSTVGVPGEISTIPTTPFQVTVANGATFAADHGVLDLTTGLWMTRAATATGTGVYAVNATTGQYTFNTADSAHKVAIAYAYTSALLGKTVAVVNTNCVLATGIQMSVYGPGAAGKLFGVKFYSVFMPKIGFSLKPADFKAQNVEFFAAEDGTSGKNVADIYTGE